MCGKRAVFQQSERGLRLGARRIGFLLTIDAQATDRKICDKKLKAERERGLFRVFNSSTSSSILLFWSFVEERVCFHEDTKERKGLGTSPFGPSGLTNVPSPCVSLASWESQASFLGFFWEGMVEGI